MQRFIFIAIFMIVCFLMVLGLLFDAPPDLSGQVVEIEIGKGASSGEIAQVLAQTGVIRAKREFLLLAKLMGAEKDFKAGFYLFPARTPLIKVVVSLARGEVTFDGIKVTVPEGTSIYKLGQILKGDGYGDWAGVGTIKLSRLPLGFKQKYPFLQQVPIDSLEGYLYPDTYFVFADTPVAKLAGMMLERFRGQIFAFWLQNQRRSSLSLHNLLTLASIVEKEAHLASEKPLIASVFYNRLKLGMPLAADPTIKYALEQPTKKVYYNQLEVDSTYNTYKYYGLPPGPICNPGLDAFKAVLYPSQTDYLFFVAKADGSHIFSKSWAEHQRAKQIIKNSL